jgi:chorismate mutase/prephenate dehydratase
VKKELGSIRARIDSHDRRIVELLNARLALAAKIGKLKRSKGGRIYVAEREADVLRKVCGANRGPLKNEALRAVYREIMSAAIALEKPLLIAYLGPEATNTHQAALKKFGTSTDYRALTTIGDIFTAVEKGEADYGVIPIENSTEGSVRDALDLFVDSELKIVAQVYLEIEHALISREPLDRITKVYSKDQALAQCRMWLQRQLPHAQLIDAPSTARAVQVAREEPGAAAIASRLAAEHHGVPVVADGIQDQAENLTRFFVLGRHPSGSVGDGRDKSSFIISLSDEPGSLLRMLQPLSRRGINMSMIESRPSKKRPWDYYFFVDVSAHIEDPRLQAAVRQLRRICPLVKWLGSYPAEDKQTYS